jgi:hypothetical protein
VVWYVGRIKTHCPHFQGSMWGQYNTTQSIKISATTNDDITELKNPIAEFVLT